jgi:hypothetical protein
MMRHMQIVVEEEQGPQRMGFDDIRAQVRACISAVFCERAHRRRR